MRAASRICRSRSPTLAQRTAQFGVEQRAQFGVVGDTHRTRLGHLVDRKIDVLAAMVGECVPRRPVQPWQHGLTRHVLPAAPRRCEHVGGEVLGVLARPAASE